MKVGKPFLDVLNKTRGDRVPFWFMRQAGRYLPEYRELRARHKGFLDMAFNPKSACEITMQPIRRFGMDAAVIFSDILVVPLALGQKVEFVEGEGPKLEALETVQDFAKLTFRDFESRLAPVYETIAQVKEALSSSGFSTTAVLGFSGGPWTLAAYMIEGGGSTDFFSARAAAYRDPQSFSRLMDTLTEAVGIYLVNQINAGAEAVQIFDSWAGVLDSHEFSKWVVKPTKEIVKMIRSAHPHTPIIGFPRGAGQNYLSYAQETGISAIAIDTQVPPKWAARTLLPLMPVQGNLDPACLLAGGDSLVLGVERVLGDLGAGNLIFNLGHGVHKDTPIAHVEMLVNILKEYRLS